MCAHRLQCEVAIIGAGPAGTAAALFLHRQGIRTILCDKARFPRAKSCGGMLEEETYRSIEETAPGAVMNRFETIEVRIPTGRRQRLPTATVLLDRTRFDQERLHYCRRLGVKILEGCEAVSVRQHSGGVVTRTKDGTVIHSLALIAADGSGSRIRMALDIPTPWRVSTLQADIEYPSVCPAGIPQVSFFSRGAGYGWVFPGLQSVNVGVYCWTNRQVPGLFRTFLAESGFERHAGKGGWLFLRDHSTPLGRGRILLAGDSAGVAVPLTGGGLMMALCSGRAAAAAWKAGGPENALFRYRQLLDQKLRRPFHRLSLARDFYEEVDEYRTYSELLHAAHLKTGSFEEYI